MKIDKNKYLEKIECIDKMLDNEDVLNEYITNIENNKFDIPLNIEEIVKFKINSENLDYARKNNYKYLNILKVACFTFVVMIIWTAMTNISFASKTSEDLIAKEEVENLERESKISTIYGKVNDFTSIFSSALLSPIEFKGGEK